MSGMTCLSDGSCCSDSLLTEGMMSRRSSAKEAERLSAANGLFLAEKMFPVYAMGILRPELEPAVSVSDSGDPIWETVRKEAKLEVLFNVQGPNFHVKVGILKSYFFS